MIFVSTAVRARCLASRWRRPSTTASITASRLLKNLFPTNFSLNPSQTCSCGFSSGEHRGRNASSMLGGIFRFFAMCQPAWSINSNMCSSGCRLLISSRNNDIAWASTHDSTMLSCLPSFGLTAPKTYTNSRTICLATVGRTARLRGVDAPEPGFVLEHDP